MWVYNICLLFNTLLKHYQFTVLIRKWLKIFLTKETMMMMLWDSMRNCYGINTFLYSVYDIYIQPIPWGP